MTGAPGLGLGRLRRWPARLSLRARLLAVMLMLVTLALAGAGFTAVAAQRGYLLHREDSQLQAAAAELSGAAGKRGRGGPADGDGDNGQQSPSAYVTETLAADGSVVSGPTSNLLDTEEALPRFPRLTASEARSRTQPFTVASVTGDGTWRVVAAPEAGPGQETLLVAAGTADLDSTLAHLRLTELVIGVTALVLMAGAGVLLVRAALRPLLRVEDTAAAIAAGDLTRRVPLTEVTTEVGQLGRSVNTMLEHIEDLVRDRTASEADARRSEEKMRRFIADASHELRTPLTSIRGFAELFRLTDTGTQLPEVARGMRRIEAESTRMALLVEDLLLLARLDQERPLRQEPVDLLDVAGTAVRDLHLLAPERAVSLRTDPSDSPPTVMGDPDRLHQIVGNLLSNAVRHTPPATAIELRLSTDQVEAARTVTLEVIDHGPGLTPEQAARVFERFYRVDVARSRDAGGAGLGLAIVAALVGAHHGTVSAHVTPGGGATFRVTLPAVGSPSA